MGMASLGLLAFLFAAPEDSPVGVFKGNGDVGEVQRQGKAVFDAATKSYTISGGGENMWFAKDAFHFVWTRVEGDMSISADVAFVGKGGDPHRKACLMIRQSLDADSAYVDAALHGDGLTSLQFRESKGTNTHEVQSATVSPTRLKLVKRGKYATLFVGKADEPLSFSGSAVRIEIQGPLYVGLGVCAHDKSALETATFSNVEIKTSLPAAAKPKLFSTLETQSLSSTDRRVVHVAEGRFEAPNWLRDGKTLVFNKGGRLCRIPAAGGKPEVIDTGFAVRCNNDHGVSPDGTLLAISDQSQADRKSRIYTVPVEGGKPTLVTESAPSYWHGWSPDGKTLAYCAERNGEYDVYAIPTGGGMEVRLTDSPGLDDGPEYSPDGKFIYFNSERTGRMQIWRINADGGEPTAVTNDAFNNWFPHPSPDGRTLVFLSYPTDVKGHPEDKDVSLRRMYLADRRIDVLANFLGGQGTVNVPCFSPDGKKIAFVTYQWIHD